MTTMAPTADVNQETGAQGGSGGGGGGGGGAPPGPPVLGPRKPSEQFTVDDFLYEMESRPQNRGSSLGPVTAAAAESGVFSEENSDMYAQLEQKERDLVLAAELGKVLLDKNEELSRQNERIAEEFSLKLEVRRPSTSRNSEYCLGDSLNKQWIRVTTYGHDLTREVPCEMEHMSIAPSRPRPRLFTHAIRHAEKRCRQMRMASLSTDNIFRAMIERGKCKSFLWRDCAGVTTRWAACVDAYFLHLPPSSPRAVKVAAILPFLSSATAAYAE